MSEILISLLAALVAELLPRAITHAMDDSKKRKTVQVNFRIEEDLKEKLDAACETVDEEASEVVRLCIKAFIESVDRDQEITKPFAIVGKRRLAALESQAGTHTEAPIPPPAGTIERKVHDVLCPPKHLIREQKETPAKAVSTTAPGGSSMHSLNEEEPSKATSKPATAGPHPRSTRGIKAVSKRGQRGSEI